MTTQIGPHRLQHGDITTGSVDVLMQSELADVVYSDPPWGNQRYWHTHNKSGQPRTDWLTFLATFCRVCATYRKADAPVFVEMGRQWVGDLDAAMTQAGLLRLRQWEISYGRPARPHALLLYGADKAVDLLETHGEAVTRLVLAATLAPGSVVLDPCCGKGMTSRYTHKLGGAFRGNELNASRLAVTEAWLRRHV